MKYHIISSVMNYNENWDYPVPTGHMRLGQNVPFSISPDYDGGASIIAVSPTDDNEIMSHTIYPHIDRQVDGLYILLNVKFGLRVVNGLEWEKRKIGAIEVRSSDGRSVKTDLVLGSNIRDWCPNNHPDAVFALTDDHASWCWQSADREFSFDCLKMPFYDDMDIDSICITARLDVAGKPEKAQLLESKAVVKKTAKGQKPEAEIVSKKVDEGFPTIQVLAMTATGA